MQSVKYRNFTLPCQQMCVCVFERERARERKKDLVIRAKVVPVQQGIPLLNRCVRRPFKQGHHMTIKDYQRLQQISFTFSCICGKVNDWSVCLLNLSKNTICRLRDGEVATFLFRIAENFTDPLATLWRKNDMKSKVTPTTKEFDQGAENNTCN